MRTLFSSRAFGPSSVVATVCTVVALLVLTAAPAVAGSSFTRTVNQDIDDTGNPFLAKTSTISLSELPFPPEAAGGILPLKTIIVTVNITHDYPGDLDIILVPPGIPWVPGLTADSRPEGAILLFKKDQTLPAGANLTNTRFTGTDDVVWVAEGPITAGSAPYTGVYTADDQQYFGELYKTPYFARDLEDGVPGNYPQWTLVVIDADPGDTGRLVSWSITFSDPAEIQVERPAGTILGDGASDALGTVDRGAAQALDYTVRNLSPTKELIVSNTEFLFAENCSATISQTAFTVPAAGSVVVTVNVTPTEVGTFSGRLRFTSDDPNEEDADIFISGTAWYPAAEAPTAPIQVGPNGTFATASEAFAAVVANGVTGPTTIELTAPEGSDGVIQSDANFAFIGAIAGVDANNPLTIRPAAGQRVVITGGGASSPIFGSVPLAIHNGASHIIVEDIEFDGETTQYWGVGVSSSGVATDGVIIRRCIFHGFRGSGLAFYNSSGSATAINGAIAENNYIYDCELNNSGGGSLWVYRNDASLTHNTLVTHPSQTNWLVRLDASVEQTANFSYNACHVTSGRCFVLPSGVPVQGDYNRYYLYSANAFGPGSPETIAGTWQTAGLGTNDLVVSSLLLEDPAGGDPTPRSNSPLVGAAVGSTATEDLRGTTRPQGAEREIGAIELRETIGTEADIRVENYPTVLDPDSRDIITSGESVAFGSLGDNVTTPFRIRISNTGNTDLTLNGVTISDERSVSIAVVNAPPGSIPGGSFHEYILEVTAYGAPSQTLGAGTTSVTGTDVIQCITSGAFTDLTAGDWIRLSGFANSANNTDLQVVSVDSVELGAIYDITVVAGASTADGDRFTINVGGTDQVFEFDSNSSYTTGRFQVEFTGSETAAAMQDLVKDAINSAGIGVTTADGSSTSIVRVFGGTVTEQVANAGFTVATIAASGGQTMNRISISGATLVPEDGATRTVSYVTTPPSFTVSVASNDPDSYENPHTFDVTGTFVEAGSIASVLGLVRAPSTTAIASGNNDTIAGNIPLSVPLMYEYTIVNTGTADLTLSGSPTVEGLIAILNITTSVSTQPGVTTLRPREFTTFVVSVQASAATSGTATFSIANNSATNPHTFGMTITSASTPLIDVVDEVVFDTITFYLDETISAGSADTETRIATARPGSMTFSTKTITVRNLGDVAMDYELVAGALDDAGGYFTFDSSSLGLTIGGGAGSIPAGSSDTITITYMPTSPLGAPFVGSLTITTNTGGVASTTTVITLTGNIAVDVSEASGCVMASTPGAIRGGAITLLGIVGMLLGLALLRRRREGDIAAQARRAPVPARVRSSGRGLSKWVPLFVVIAVIGFANSTAAAQAPWETTPADPEPEDKPETQPQPDSQPDSGRDNTEKDPPADTGSGNSGNGDSGSGSSDSDSGDAPWESDTAGGEADDPWQSDGGGSATPPGTSETTPGPAGNDLTSERPRELVTRGVAIEVGIRFGQGSADDTGANSFDRHWLLIGTRVGITNFDSLTHQLNVNGWFEFGLDPPTDTTLLRPFVIQAEYEFFFDFGEKSSFNLALFLAAGVGMQVLDSSVPVTDTGSWISIQIDAGVHGYISPGISFTVAFGFQQAIATDSARPNFTYINGVAMVGWRF